MKLTCLGSGSAGNCYLLHNETECIVIEAGVPFKEVKKALGFNIRKIIGVVVSHEHGDHAKYLQEYIKVGIPVMAPSMRHVTGVLSAISKPFAVRTFPLVHDVPCTGFLIEHSEIGRLLFATDTEYVRYRFKNLNHIMIECNYSQDLLSKSYHDGLQERIKLTHMELGTCKDFIRENKNKELKTICLMHLSDRTSDEGIFHKEIKELVTCPVYVADKGLEYEL
ncbi:MBL fold metallo-hydrolase [Lacrimispora sp.]|uniref:MBL fold metallo-hydrolase n=1 Tax=Lacrimispora sp. TaxID=2719234 RepID=UPI0028A98D3D|nr:MBL fold metallo-hydrolase [Lacrimispora sp.]